MLLRFLLKQLSRPSGLLGKYILGAFWNRRNRKLNDLTLRKLKIEQSDKILEVGFGGGYLIGKMLNGGVSLLAGIDASEEMVRNARRRYAREISSKILNVACCAVEDIQFPSAAFSKACSVNSIFYWHNLESGLRQMYRVLKPTGHVFITFTAKRDIDKKGMNRDGLTSYSEEEVRRRLAAVGFQRIEKTEGQDRYRKFLCISAQKMHENSV